MLRANSSKPKRSSERPTAPTAETIWVGVRIRPLSYLEHIQRDQDSWDAGDDFTLRYTGEVDRSHAHLPPAYCYDRVFGTHTSSQQVYEAAAKDRVMSALQGLNATLFVYGQTGSGKTYTMRSIVQAAAQDLFHHIRHTPGAESLQIHDLRIGITAMRYQHNDLQEGNTPLECLQSRSTTRKCEIC